MFHNADTGEQTVVAGWGYSPDGGVTHPERGRGLAVPTREEFLAELPNVPVLLDVKPETRAMSDALLADSDVHGIVTNRPYLALLGRR